MQLKYGGANLYECLQRVPWLSTTLLAIDQAGTDVQKLFKNNNLEVTFFAMDNQNWVTLGQWQTPKRTVAQILADKPFTATVSAG